MKFEEVLPALREGKKIRRKEINEAFDAKDRGFLTITSFLSEDWEVVQETVDFATAWQAYENGRQIKSEFFSGIYEKYQSDRGDTFTSDEIRGKWIIL